MFSAAVRGYDSWVGKRKIKKHTTGGIPRWSHTLVLVARFSAYVWQSGRDAQFSLTYGRMCLVIGNHGIDPINEYERHRHSEHGSRRLNTEIEHVFEVKEHKTEAMLSKASIPLQPQFRTKALLEMTVDHIIPKSSPEQNEISTS
jgi:hypothetical protein